MAALRLPDGRLLAFDVRGASSGTPVVALHGTPGSSRQLAGLDLAARAHGITLVTPDRAGYGRSSYDPERSLAAGARDVASLLRHLGIDRCAVMGLSGGGPFALACGVVSAHQVTSVVTIGGVAPLVPRDPSLPPDRFLTKVARRSQTGARALFAVMLRAGQINPEKVLERFASLLAEPDARLLRENGPLREGLLDDLRHPAPTAARAAARDFWLFAHRWDVDLAQMTPPVHVWHGTRDRNVPVQHARVVAQRCPTARLHLIDGGGHLPFAHLESILADIAPA